MSSLDNSAGALTTKPGTSEATPVAPPFGSGFGSSARTIEGLNAPSKAIVVNVVMRNFLIIILGRSEGFILKLFKELYHLSPRYECGRILRRLKRIFYRRQFYRSWRL